VFFFPCHEQAEKTGWLPLPQALSNSDYDTLFSIANDTQKDLLSRWFLLDTNAVGRRVLQPSTAALGSQWSKEAAAREDRDLWDFLFQAATEKVVKLAVCVCVCVCKLRCC
jgi:hypothetical protein